MTDNNDLRSLVASTNNELRARADHSKSRKRESNTQNWVTIALIAALGTYTAWQAFTLLFRALEEPLTTKVEIVNFRDNIVEHILTYSAEHDRLPENLHEVFQSSLDDLNNGTITITYAKDPTGFNLVIVKNGKEIDSYRGNTP